MAARTDAEGAQIVGQFHQNCGRDVKLSEFRRVASGAYPYSAVPIAFSNAHIPNGLQFSLKVLQEGSWSPAIGVTTKSPDSGPVPQQLADIQRSDQYWRVWLGSDCTVWHKAQSRVHLWNVDRSPGNTFGIAISETGELHLYHNGQDVGVAWEGLPTGKPLWGFVILSGWKVETNYIIAKGHPQDYAGKTYLFVERPPDGLTCAVCQALAHDPVQANCCGNVYCARCIERWKGRSHSCPTCRSTEQSDPPFNVFSDKRAFRDVRCLSVHCPNTCGKKMDLSEVDNHLTSDSGCPFQVVDCGNKCGHKEKRAGVKKHMTSECRLRCEKCQYCPLVSTHEQVTGAHLKECPNFPLNCPNKCSAQGLTRSTVPAHRGVCRLQQVECEFKQFGCVVFLPRREMEGHLKASVQDHLWMTKRKVEEERAERRLMEARLKEVESTLASLLARMK